MQSLFEFFFKYSLQDYARSDLVFTAEWPAWLLLLLATVAVAGLSAALWRHRGAATAGQLLAVWTLQLVMLALVAVLLLASLAWSKHCVDHRPLPADLVLLEPLQ